MAFSDPISRPHSTLGEGLDRAVQLAHEVLQEQGLSEAEIRDILDRPGAHDASLLASAKTKTGHGIGKKS